MIIIDPRCCRFYQAGREDIRWIPIRPGANAAVGGLAYVDHRKLLNQAFLGHRRWPEREKRTASAEKWSLKLILGEEARWRS